MPRWRSAAIVLALLALGQPLLVVAGAATRQLLSDAHHEHPGRAAEHGHEHPSTTVEHDHEATTETRTPGAAPPQPAGLPVAATTLANPRSPRAAGFGRCSGCDPPPVRPDPVLRI